MAVAKAVARHLTIASASIQIVSSIRFQSTRRGGHTLVNSVDSKPNEDIIHNYHDGPKATVTFKE